MNRPAYYLWKTDFATQEEFEKTKDRLQGVGYRVVTYIDGDAGKDIHEGLKAVIRNHMQQAAQL